jgi:hypothetical protein
LFRRASQGNLYLAIRRSQIDEEGLVNALIGEGMMVSPLLLTLGAES